MRKGEERQDRMEGRQDATDRQLVEVRGIATDVAGRIGRVEGRVEAVDSHLTRYQLELLQKLGEVQNSVIEQQASTRAFFAEKDAVIRERVARVEQRTGIPHEE